jgi:hypothetical protein
VTVIPFPPRGGSNQPESSHQPDQPNRDEIAKTILSLALQGGNLFALARVGASGVTLPIPKLELDRLAKLCGMFGSAHAGERAAAAAKADQLVRNLGLTWFDVPSVTRAATGET